MKAPGSIVVLLSVLYLYGHAVNTVGGDTDCNVNQDRTDHLIQSLKGCADALQSSCTCTSEAESNCLSKEEILCRLDEQAEKITKLQESIDNISEMLCIQQPSPLPTSCQDIATQWPNSSSGVYLIASASGRTHYVYCPFTTLCGSEGWTRVAYLNMSDSSAACPDELQLLQSNDGVRGCGRKSSNTASCNGLTFPSIHYNEICGRVIGYQIGSTDAVNTNYGGGDNDINSHYVDGVSITRGSPRQHVWTFMAGLQENSINYDGRFECPCSTGTTQTVQPFIGDSYFCESGTPGRWDSTTFRSQDPLWDGKECGSIETDCCQASGIPWFHKVIGSPTTDSIEMRVCGDQLTSDENVAVGLVEIYVK